MTLRAKILAITSATLVGLMIVVYLTSRMILLDSFARLEERESRESLQRGLAALADETAQLNSIAGDWALWDDAYDFVETANETFIRSNLTEDAFINLRLNLMMFVDLSGGIVYSRLFDYRNKTEVDVPQGLPERLADSTSSLLVRQSDAQGGVAGVLLLPEAESPLLVAARPILRSGGKGATRGTLVVGRLLDTAEIAQLARLTHLALSVSPFDRAHLPLSDVNPMLFQPLSDETAVGYAMVKDIHAQPSLVLRVNMSRDIYQRGQASLNYINLSLLIVGLVFIVVTMILWDRLALSRLTRLVSDVSRIGSSGDVAERVGVTGSDELSDVAGSINQMLEALQHHSRELAALNRAGQAILSLLDLQAVLELVIAESRSLLNAEAMSVLLYDQAVDELVFAAVDSPRSEQLTGKRIPSNAGIAGWAVHQKHAVLVHDAYNDPRFYAQVDETTGMITRSVLAVPLITKDAVIGVIEAINKAGGLFDQHDLETLEAMASSAAIATENARLFERERRVTEHLQALSRRLVGVQEQERGRVARELHDEAGQSLSSLMVNLRLLEQDAHHPEKVVALVGELKQMTNAVLEDLHRLAVDLRPASLDHVGLVAALRQYIESFSRQHNVRVQFEAVRLDDGRMPTEVETALYRIVQEALTNVVRHARASQVDVILERRGDHLVLLVEDNGVGFVPESAVADGRLGLVGIKERAEMLGGTLTIESEVGRGATVLVEVPYVHSHSSS